MKALTQTTDTPFQPQQKYELREALAVIGGVIVLCLFLLNMFGGIVSSIWLAVKGEWALIIGGFLSGLLMPWAFSIAALPAVGLAMLANRRGPPSHMTAAIIGFCALWNAALLALWTLGIFFIFMQCAEPALTIPLLLWGYAVTITPLAGMARGEDGDAVGTKLGLALAMLAYVMLAILFLVGAQQATMVVCVGVLAVLEAVLCTALGVTMTRPKQVLQSIAKHESTTSSDHNAAVEDSAPKDLSDLSTDILWIAALAILCVCLFGYHSFVSEPTLTNRTGGQATGALLTLGLAGEFLFYALIVRMFAANEAKT